MIHSEQPYNYWKLTILYEISKTYLTIQLRFILVSNNATTADRHCLSDMIANFILLRQKVTVCSIMPHRIFGGINLHTIYLDSNREKKKKV